MRRQGSALADAPRHLSDLAQRVEELSERTERDVVSFVAVAKDLRHASEMLLQESNLLREVQVAQSLRSDAIEHALFAQRRQLDRLEAVLATQATQNEGLHQRVVELTTANVRLRAHVGQSSLPGGDGAHSREHVQARGSATRSPVDSAATASRLADDASHEPPRTSGQGSGGRGGWVSSLLGRTVSGSTEGAAVSSDGALAHSSAPLCVFVIHTEGPTAVALAHALKREIRRLRDDVQVLLAGDEPAGSRQELAAARSCGTFAVLLDREIGASRQCVFLLELAAKVGAPALPFWRGTESDAASAALGAVAALPAEAARLFAQAPPAERLASGADVAEAAERLLLQVRLAVDAAGGIDWHIGMPSAVRTAALVLCEAAVGKDTTPQQLLAHRNLTLGTAQLNPGSAQLEALSLLLPRMRDLRSIELTAGASTSTVAKRQLAALLRAREPPITSFGCGRWHFTEPSGALTLRGLDSPDVELLAALVRGAPALSSLSLPDCSADVDAGAQLLGALQAHGGIEELSGVPLARLSRDEVAELAGDGLSDVEVVALAAVLPQAVSLRAIDLSGGRISARAAALLGAALSHHPSCAAIRLHSVWLPIAEIGSTAQQLVAELSERRLGAADLALVTAVLPAHPGLHALSLRANPICAPQPWAREVKVGADDEGGEIDLGGVAALGRSLAELSVLVHLDLSFCALGNTGLRLLIDGVCAATSLRTLALAGCALSAAAATVLAAALPSTHLASLDISRNPLCELGRDTQPSPSEGGVLALASTVGRNTTVNALDLSYVGLTTSAALALAAALCDSTSLRVARLRGCELSGTVVKALAPAVATGRLMELDLRDNLMDTETAAAVMHAVEGSGGLELFCGVPLLELRSGALAELDLSGRRIGIAGVLVLARLIERNQRALVSVALDRSDLGPEGTFALVTALFSVPTLRHLSLAHNAMCGDVQWGAFHAAGLDAIAALLRAGAPISSLSLRGNRLREQGAAILAAALPHAAALERLDVRETEMFAAEAELRAAWGRAERTTLLI